MQQGFIKIHRKIIDNPIYQNAGLLQLFIHCILKANHKGNDFIFNGKMITIRRGTFITGRKELSKELKASESKIYRNLQTLAKFGYINIIPFNKFSIIEVLNYNKYQNEKMTEKEGKSEKSNNKNTVETPISKAFTEGRQGKSNNKVTTKEQQSNTNKNDKNEKNNNYDNRYRNFVVKLLSKVTGKELSTCYALTNKLIKLKEMDKSLSYLQKCLMLLYIIKKYQDSTGEEKYIGILVNQYRELSYSDFKTAINNQAQSQQTCIYNPNYAGALN